MVVPCTEQGQVYMLSIGKLPENEPGCRVQ